MNDLSLNRRRRVAGTVLVLLAVFGLAVGVRLYRIADWSLWQDEETSLYFSQHLEKPFARFFPAFFCLLHGLYKVTGVSVVAGRLLALFFGVAGIAATYQLCRRWFSHRVGVVAALLLAANLGHLYMCQSLRYYTLVTLLQLLCALWFFEGLEKGCTRRLLLSNAALGLALWTHHSALLVVPVLLGYLALAWGLGERWANQPSRTYVIFLIPHLIILAFFLWQFQAFRALNFINVSSPLAGDQSALGLAIRLAAYFGAPMFILGALAPLLGRVGSPRALVLVVMLAVVPVVELFVIAQLRLSLVAWYYIPGALPPLAILAALTLVGLYERGRRVAASALAGTALLYAAGFLVGYFTVMHGDRPRYQEATVHLAALAVPSPTALERMEIYASVPGVVAYYLGVPPGETMGHARVQLMPDQPPAAAPMADQWYVVEQALINPEYATWFAQHCELRGRFEAQSGPKDRSVLVYQRKAPSARAAL